ncbi:DUF6346 domain-containing protein [Saccharothrix luteola]|uniref:DUF6346 domain-containing protein n=1 Tax=Saccharothrix luteola TaxID=2893018 RepID=UPI0035569F78
MKRSGVFAGRHGPGYRVGGNYVVATECKRHGPVSTHGFGFWYRCTAGFHFHGRTYDSTTPGAVRPVNFLTLADLARQSAAQADGEQSQEPAQVGAGRRPADEELGPARRAVRPAVVSSWPSRAPNGHSRAAAPRPPWLWRRMA